MTHDKKMIKNCQIGKNTKIYDFVNLYGCIIGNNCLVGCFVEIQQGVKVGNNVKVESHSFLCEGVQIEDNVFIGHHVVFVNDKYPRATNQESKPKAGKDWILLKTVVKQGASIGSNSTILGGVTIGKNAMVGAGSVVTKDVGANTVVAGNPAKALGRIPRSEK